MPFASQDPDEFRILLTQCLAANPDWSDNEALREIHERGCEFRKQGVLEPSLEKLFSEFEMHYNQNYARQHDLQRFLNLLAQHAVRTRSANPIVELISAIDKKVIQ